MKLAGIVMTEEQYIVFSEMLKRISGSDVGRSIELTDEEVKVLKEISDKYKEDLR